MNSFLLALSFAQIPWGIVSALLIGGVIAAPLAAYIVRLLPARILGTAVAGIILLTNMQTSLETVGVSGATATVIYAVIATVSLSALAWRYSSPPMRKSRRWWLREKRLNLATTVNQRKRDTPETPALLEGLDVLSNRGYTVAVV